MTGQTTEEWVAITIESVTMTEEGGAARYFVTLQDVAKRQMRVYIGKSEALALSLGLQGHAPDRPQTYEAFLACLTALGAAVEEVCIHNLQNETFYAEAHLHLGDSLHPVDMRPSDALNLAVRVGCPLYVSEPVFLACLAMDSGAAATQASETRTVTAAKAPVVLSASEVSDDLARLFTEDQADRMAVPIDWEAAGSRDKMRLARVKQLYHGQLLQTGSDYYHAAMVLQHSSAAEDHLLAHEFCIVAISLGVESAKWLAAASEDRFLQNIGRLQRFGTQCRKASADSPWSPGEISPEIEDCLCRALNVPPRFQAQADEMSKPE